MERIFVGGLHSSITKEDIAFLLSKFGKVSKSEIITDSSASISFKFTLISVNMRRWTI